MRHGAKGSDFYFLCIVKIHCILNYLKYNGIFLLQNDKSYLICVNFESNPPSTVNTAKFDCLDLYGQPCILIIYDTTVLTTLFFSPSGANIFTKAVCKTNETNYFHPFDLSSFLTYLKKLKSLKSSNKFCCITSKSRDRLFPIKKRERISNHYKTFFLFLLGRHYMMGLGPNPK